MAEFQRLPLPEVLEFREGPGILARDFRPSGVPLLRLAGLKPGAALLSGCNFLDPQMVESKWKRFRLRLGDTLLSTSASLGEVATVDESGVGAVPYTGIIALRPRDARMLPEFVPIALTERSFKMQIEAMGVGSVMRHFGPSHLGDMTVTVPSPPVQQAIVDVIGALDDKIAGNARVTVVADALAFEQFRLLRETAARRPLSSTAAFVNGKAFTKGASGTGRVVIRIAELNSGVGRSTVYSDADVADVHVAHPGDILFAWSGSLTLHRWFREPGIVNQHIFKVIPNPGVPHWLAYQLVRSKLDDFKAIAADKATTMGHIQRKHLDALVPVPDVDTVRKFDGLMGGLWDVALAAERESVLLGRLRDALLPELMSGRMRVRDAEELVSEVG